MTIVYLGVAWLAGVLLASIAELPWLTLALGASIAVVAAKRHPRGRLLAASVAALALGGARFAGAAPTASAYHIVHFNGQESIVIKGWVAAAPEVHDRYTALRVRALALHDAGGESRPVDGLVLVQTGRFPVHPYGTELDLAGGLESTAVLGDSGYASYLERQGIYSVMRWPELTVTGDSGGNALRRWLDAARQRAAATIYSVVPEPQASLLTGILLGDDSGLSEPMQDAFRTTGMTHIIAISGFNIALLAGVLLRAGRPLLGYRAAAWAALIGVALYALFVGAEASVVRAAIMGGLYVIATRLLGRPTFAPAALVTAAVLMTIVQPLALWDVGFQLSFAATLGLMLYTAPMGKWSQAQFEHRFSRPNAIRITGFLSEVVLATIAAQLLVLPLLAYHFGQFSLISLPANLLILPAQPAVMTWGGLTTLVGFIATPLAQPLAWVAWLFLAYTTSMVQLLAQVPAAAFPVRLDLSGLIALYALILGITWWTRQEAESRDAVRSRWVGRVRPVAVLSAVAITTLLAWQWARSQPDGRLHVTFFDVGQGDAILIETPRGRQILVDGGHEPSLLNEHLGRTLPFWDRSLDLVVATHPDADHVAGLPGVLERYRVDLLLTDGTPLGFSATYDALLIAADRAGTPIDAADAGQTVSLDEELTLVVLHPDRGQSFEDNDRSVSLRLTYGEFTLLLTGDAEERAERTMVDSGRELRSLIFKAGHHGAHTSSNDFFLASVQPQVVVVSAGADNRFGHPHEESLQRAAAVGATVLRTDELGTIEVVTDGEQMWWEASK